MEAPAKFVPSDVLYWSRGRLGGWQLGCVCAVGIRVVRKNILHSAKGKRRRTFSPTCPSIRRHGGRGEVGVAELTASAGAEESCGKQVEIRGVPAGVRPRFTLEDQGRSTTISSKRRHHMVSGSATQWRLRAVAAPPWTDSIRSGKLVIRRIRQAHCLCWWVF